MPVYGRLGLITFRQLYVQKISHYVLKLWLVCRHLMRCLRFLGFMCRHLKNMCWHLLCCMRLLVSCVDTSRTCVDTSSLHFSVVIHCLHVSTPQYHVSTLDHQFLKFCLLLTCVGTKDQNFISRGRFSWLGNGNVSKIFQKCFGMFWKHFKSVKY